MVSTLGKHRNTGDHQKQEHQQARFIQVAVQDRFVADYL
jgi:hypothetical protein